MPIVNILRREPHEDDSEARMKAVPALYVRGPWAVTPSDNADCPGFTVTFVPTGRKAWPNQPGPAALARAKELVDGLMEVWPHAHQNYTGIEKDRILFLVRPQ